MHYDVIVMGAGPAGCMATRELTAHGFRVLLMERGTLPRDKACGGILTPDALAIIEEAFGPLPRELREGSQAVRGLRLLCEGGGEYELPFCGQHGGEGLMVQRSLLDAFLARGSGAEVADGCEVTDFDLGRFRVGVTFRRGDDEGHAQATYLVGADGAESLALRLLRPEFHRLHAAPHLERAMLVTCEGDARWDRRWMGLVLSRDGTGLSRFFVRGDTVGMAVTFRGEGGWRHELQSLQSFLSSRVGLETRGEAVRAAATSNRMGARGNYCLGAGCALLVGEAAGLLDPWGFGIRLALESGRLAALSIVESAGENMTPHLRYRYLMQPLLEREAAQRRFRSGQVGEVDLSALDSSPGRAARRDRRALRRRL